MTSPAAAHTKVELKLNGSPIDIPITHVLYQLYTSWSRLLIKFPKSQRYTLGEVCQQRLLSALEAVIAAASSADTATKRGYLQTASAKIDLTRLLVRLAKDTKCISNPAYLQLESQLHDAGRMCGGWLKSL